MRKLSLIWVLANWGCTSGGDAPEPDWEVSTFQQRFWHGYCSMTQPAVREGVVYLGGGYAWDGNTYVSAIELKSRRVIWRFETSQMFTGSSILIGREAVYTAAGEILYALSRDRGTLLWSYAHVGDHRLKDEEIIYTTRRGPALVALDARTGAELWRLPTREWLKAPPVVLGQNVYYSDNGILQSADRVTGRTASPLPQFLKTARLTTAKQDLYFTAQSPSRDRRRVTVAWQPATGQLDVYDKEILSIQNDVIYFVKESGIQAIDVDTGAELWFRDNLATASLGGSVFHGDVMFQRDLQGDYGSLNAFNIGSGEKLWAFQTDGWLEEPLVDNTLLFLLSDDCKLYVFDLR